MLHTLPHPPQFAASVSVDVSQPLAGLPSQSANPALHTPRPPVLTSQAGMPLGGAGPAILHAPQFFASPVRFCSQPFLASLSQSPKPVLQLVTAQAPAVQVDDALASMQPV